MLFRSVALPAGNPYAPELRDATGRRVKTELVDASIRGVGVVLEPTAEIESAPGERVELVLRLRAIPDAPLTFETTIMTREPHGQGLLLGLRLSEPKLFERQLPKRSRLVQPAA